MNTLPSWACWFIAAALLLLSPVFAFLSALLVEILLGIVREGGVSALAALAAASVIGPVLLRRLRVRSPARDIVGDQA